MFDVGWSEMAIIVLVALVVIGPKDLPRVMRSVGHWMRKARSLTREFQSSFEEMMREADLEDARQAIESARNFDVKKAVADTVDPTGDVKKELSDVEETARRSDADQSPKAAEPPAESTGEAGEAGAAKKPSDEEAEPQATFIHHPAQMAPPHSIKPPEEPSVEEDVAAAEDDHSGGARAGRSGG